MTTVKMNAAIKTAVEKYLEDNNNTLDPIGKRQIHSWNFEWTSATGKSPSALFQETQTEHEEHHDQSGSLVWKLSNQENPFYVTLSSTCFWTETSLEWTCYARAKAVANTPSEPKAMKIFKRLHERLKKDDYISKLYSFPKIKRGTELDGNCALDGVILAQASIVTQQSGLEERVFTDPDIAEGIKRVVWNTSQDPIDVLEFVIQYLPLLPSTCFNVGGMKTTKLADRAILRLLEDAMCDACEREGEEELVNELHIQKKSRCEKGAL